MLRFLFLLVLALPVIPQDGLPTTVKEIRQLYTDTQQGIALMSDEEHLRKELVTTIQRNMPGTGIRKETVTCYFAEFGDDLDPDYRPYFVTRKYNVAAHRFYEEFLFDAETGKLLFVFRQGDSYETAGAKDETRYYFGPQGLLSENIKGERRETADEAINMANECYKALKASLDGFKNLVEY